MVDKNLFMSVMSQIADMPVEELWTDVIPHMVKHLDDNTLTKLHWVLHVECQERFVAVGDQEPIDKYENIRGE